VTESGQFEEHRGEDLRTILAPGELPVEIGPGRRDGGPSPRRKLQHDPWLVLPPEHVDPGGELAADAAVGLLADPDVGAAKK
jgi:hypothetical protein